MAGTDVGTERSVNDDVLVTGGAGFIGSNFVRYALADASRLARHHARQADLRGAPREPARRHGQSAPHVRARRHLRRGAWPARSSSARTVVVHFAAETHVDRSILAAGDFIKTDVVGTFVLLEAARRATGAEALHPDFHRRGLRQRARGREPRDRRAAAAQPVLGQQGRRRSAGLQLLGHATSVPVIVTRASNNYGPYQFPEKVIPLFVTNAIDDIPVPLYGDGRNVRDWLHVLDHCRALDLLIERGTNGEVYNIGGGNEVKNVDLTHRILELLGQDADAHQAGGRSPRPRSALQPRHHQAARASAGRRRCRSKQGLRETVEWYQANEWWWRPIKERDPALQGLHRSAVRQALMALPSWSPARRDSSAATCSSCSSATREIVAWQRPGTEPPRRAASRWIGTVELHDREAVAARGRRRAAPGDLSPGRRRRTSASRGQHIRETFAGNVAGDASPVRCDAARGVCKPRVLVTSSAIVYAPVDRADHRTGRALPEQPLRHQQARAGDARRRARGKTTAFRR